MPAIPAIKARLGSTDYYILSMKAGALANTAIIPSEVDNWAAKTVEEKFQRNIKYARVEKQIAPYLVRNKNRFFGSIIIAAENFSDDQFESLSMLADAGVVPAAYRNATEGVGVINFTGGEVLIPLDGQHRIKAIKYAISGRGKKDQELDFGAGFGPDTKLADENVCVILVPYSQSWARKVFIIVNKFAKTTTLSENIIINDDDIVACITRKIANDVIGAELVDIEKPNLNESSGSFTTLVTIYKCTEKILKMQFGDKFLPKYRVELPSEDTKIAFESFSIDIWKKLTRDIDKWQLAIEDKRSTGDDYRRDLRKSNLLGRPIVHRSLLPAYIRLTASGLSHKKACENLNNIEWATSESRVARPEWQSVFIAHNNKMTNKEVPLAIDIIAYMACEDINTRTKEKLFENYKNNHWKSGVALPPRVCD